MFSANDEENAGQRAERETSRVVWWLLGVSTAALGALTGAWMHGVNNDVDTLKVNITAIQAIDARLTRVENKLDKVLERGEK